MLLSGIFLPRPPRHLSTFPPHLQSTLPPFPLFPRRLTVHAGCFSFTTSQFPGIRSRGAGLRSNFLGSTHSCYKRTAIGGRMGAGLRREPSGRQQRRLFLGPKRSSQKDFLAGLPRGGGRSPESVLLCLTPPPSDRKPEPVRRNNQSMRAWSPASSSCPTSRIPGSVAGFLAPLPRTPNILSSSLSIRPLL